MVTTSLRSLQLNAGFSLFLSPNRTIFPNGCLKIQKRWKHSMSLSAKPLIVKGVLSINGKELLTGVPENVLITPVTDESIFLGAISSKSRSRHIFKIGVLEDYRFICLSRYKLWWMLPQMGNSGSDIPLDSQMLLLEAREDFTDDEGSLDVSKGGTFYVLFLPVLDGDFRSSLQGNPKNELEFCIESGDTSVETSQSLEAVLINYGNNPFDLMKNSMKILEKKKGTFSHRETKKVPGILDWFGWCTWDAFYTDVNPQGIENGLKCFTEGGTPARFLIIDDGWQDTANKFQQEGKPPVEGSQFASRLVSIKENNKFRKTENEATDDLKEFITAIKKTYGLKYVYMWHALMGYWGGLDPDAPGTKKYNPKLLYPVQSPGNIVHTRCSNLAGMEKYGVGTVDPAKVFDFYDDQHSYLVSQNVDGVKVDAQCLLETLGNSFGGRISLTRQYQEALENSISKNFQDNSIICCMAHNTDSVYHWKQSAIARASDDFYPEDPSSHSVHIAAVAFNSIFIGEVMVPDWDMFYSHHYAAEFHAVARAVGGCGVYVSDKPGQHDFTILKRLVLPDGSVLRAKYPGRPTRDCLFDDPVMGGKSLLKIWNLNTFSGVLGIFNCQGKGIWPCWNSDRKAKGPEISYLTGHVSPVDIEYLEEVAEDNWAGDCAVFSYKAGSLSRLPRNGSVHVTLEVLKCDIFTISPIKVYNEKIQFAPIGLIEMYNSGGAIEAMDFVSDRSSLKLNMKGRGCGRFGAYSSIQPQFCTVNSKEEEFEFNIKDNFLTIIIPHAISVWEISIHFEA